MQLFVLLVDLGREDADEGESTVALVVVETVADDELVGDLTADIVGHEGDLAAAGLVEQGTGLDALGTLELEVTAEVRERSAGVDDVLDEDDVLALNVRVQILDKADDAGGF